MEPMKFIVVERFKHGAAEEIYRRAVEKGRMLPEGLRYVDSWVSTDLETCYQLMETEDEGLFSQWTRHWDDLVEFEIVRVLTSAEAAAKSRTS